MSPLRWTPVALLVTSTAPFAVWSNNEAMRQAGRELALQAQRADERAVAPERTSLTRASVGPAARRPAVDPYYYSNDPEERRDITIRELAEKQLKDIESNGPDCEPELERRIRAAM
jgi:hypothetical protein